MANELKHTDVGGSLTEAEYDSITAHQFDSQAQGDMVVASSATQLSRLAVGTARQILQTNAGGTDPEWTSNLDIPGTLDVTGAVTLDSSLTVAGTTTLNGTIVLGDAAADSLTLGGTIQGATPMVFEGESADNDFETTFAITDPTADRTITFPDLTGTVALSGTSQAWTTTGVITGATVEATGDTAAGDAAAMGYTATEGLILTGQGSTNDVTIKNDADADVIEIPTGTTNVSIAGNLTVTGGQVAFPASQSASADANTLDDYEEGTFTPGVEFGGGSTGMTFSTQVGTYTKIGQRVNVEITVILSAKGSSTGNATVTGLPFTSNSLTNNWSAVTMRPSLISFANVPLADIAPGATIINFRESTEAGTVTSLTDADFSNTSSIRMSASYRV